MAQAVRGAQGKKQEREREREPGRQNLGPAAHERVARPIDLPLGDAHGCAMLKVRGVEAGPTVLADGFEKDLALVIAL